MKIIIANQKMNMDINDVNDYINKMKMYKDNFIVCPSSIYIPYFINSGFNVGIQNVYKNDFGAYTGEVSAYQAKKLGVKYALIGHSERRILFKEDNNLLKEKIKSCLKNDVKVIFCVGETLEEKEENKTIEVIKKQLEIIEDCENIIISYEPVWSISSSNIPSLKEIKEVVNFIKKCYNVKVIYGGSVNDKTIETLAKIKELDGYIIGSSSLDVGAMMKILEVAK